MTRLTKEVKEKALRKWDEGWNVSEEEMVNWWYETGTTGCSFCSHYLCKLLLCPLKDYEDQTCSNEFHAVEKAVDQGNYEAFIEAAEALYQRINRLEVGKEVSNALL